MQCRTVFLEDIRRVAAAFDELAISFSLFKRQRGKHFFPVGGRDNQRITQQSGHGALIPSKACNNSRNPTLAEQVPRGKSAPKFFEHVAHKFPKVPPVSLAKNMNHIHLTYEMSEDRRQSNKLVPIGQQMSAELRKNLNALLPDVQRTGKRRLTLADEDVSLHPCPFIKILKHMKMQRAEVGVIESAGNAAYIDKPCTDENFFSAVEFGQALQTQPIL